MEELAGEGGTIFYEMDSKNMYAVIIRETKEADSYNIMKNAFEEEGYSITRCSVQKKGARWHLFWIDGVQDEKVIRDRDGTLHLYDDAASLYIELLKKARYRIWKENGCGNAILLYMEREKWKLLYVVSAIGMFLSLGGVLYNFVTFLLLTVMISILAFVAVKIYLQRVLLRLDPWWDLVYKGEFPEITELKKMLRVGPREEIVYKCWMLAKLAGLDVPEPASEKAVKEIFEKTGVHVEDAKVVFLKKDIAAMCPKCEDKMIVRVALIDIILSPKPIVKVAAKHRDHTVIFEIDKNFNIRRSDILTFAE